MLLLTFFLVSLAYLNGVDFFQTLVKNTSKSVNSDKPSDSTVKSSLAVINIPNIYDGSISVAQWCNV